ncbi:MAG: hypothetical protein PHQ42_01840 [Patescibacteria group bacterium]|nr:hypothetical protein [Patescibacteria group bacterium]
MDDAINKFITGAVGGAFDATISSFPGVSIIWGAIKGGVENVRKKRAEEFILFLQVNNIKESYFNDEQFVDGLGITFEQYLRQRSEYKRKLIQNVFLSFISSQNKINFELERFFEIINKISESQTHLLNNVFREHHKKKNSKGESIGSVVIMKNNYYDSSYDSYKYLEYLGLTTTTSDKEVITEYGESEFLETEHMYLSEFGKRFITFILK